MIYNYTVIGLRPNTLGMVMPKLEAAISQSMSHGKLVGCFTCDFGVLNRIAILSAYSDVNALAQDRAEMITKGNPLGFAEYLASFDQSAYRPLPFVSDIKPGAHGPYYEIRTYGVAAGGLEMTSNAWSKGIDRRTALSKLLVVMASLETVPQRMLHIWPYASLDERAAVRAQASKAGIWPPPGSSDHLLSLQSELFLATGFSPLS
jgi:hypothetical protein